MSAQYLLFSFKGRIGLLPFWLGLSLLVGAVAFVVGACHLMNISLVGLSPAAAVTKASAFILCNYVFWALMSKRLHDFGYSGFLFTVPVLNAYLLLLACFLPGSNMSNQFGEPAERELEVLVA